MKRLCALLLAALLAAPFLTPAAFAARPQAFSDVDPEAWYAWSVADTAARDLMNGTSGGQFTPDGTLTRAMMVTILWRLAGRPMYKTPIPFSDVDQVHWYSYAVGWANEHRVTNGVGNNLFGPDEPVTREQMAVLFYRWARGQGYETIFPVDDALLAEEAAVSLFVWETDDEEKHGSSVNAGLAVSDWAEDAVRWAAANDLLTRRPVSPLDPYGGSAWYLCAPEAATRAEAAVFLSRFCRFYMDGDGAAEAAVTFRPDADYTAQGGYRWDILSMDLPETWQGAYSVTSVQYEGVPNALGLDFFDLSNLRPRSQGGYLFSLILWPAGKDPGRFGGWEKLKDASPGASGRLCTLQAPMGKLDLYVVYPGDMTDPPAGPFYDEGNPKNYIKMQVQIEGFLQTLRFAEGVTVLDTAASYPIGGA